MVCVATTGCVVLHLYFIIYDTCMYSPVLFFLFLLLCAQNNVGLNWFVAVRRMSRNIYLKFRCEEEAKIIVSSTTHHGASSRRTLRRTLPAAARAGRGACPCANCHGEGDVK